MCSHSLIFFYNDSTTTEINTSVHTRALHDSRPGSLSGDFGMSTRFKGPGTGILMPRLANTAILGLGVLLVMVPLALVLGVLAGMKEGSPQDRAISVFSIATTSVPEFASGVFLVGIFVLWLKWLPGVSNMIGGFEITQMVLPVAALEIGRAHV